MSLTFFKISEERRPDKIYILFFFYKFITYNIISLDGFSIFIFTAYLLYYLRATVGLESQSLLAGSVADFLPLPGITARSDAAEAVLLRLHQPQCERRALRYVLQHPRHFKMSFAHKTGRVDPLDVIAHLDHLYSVDHGALLYTFYECVTGTIISDSQAQCVVRLHQLDFFRPACVKNALFSFTHVRENLSII